ncbi:hypothetical protein CC78DRAFT_614767 [Lojkania enalia]|uniref:Uncharacterized protein n=1 Tax=Lojkania enalia TaxID=147567 RepID=A0A9P4KDB8_9PLEO|nr:hypothetical protein CC78DRAFT_614767 [Didymosphaeria enalia]
MTRIVELGRAVLSLQSAQLQLWLTTLITVSPQRESINFWQLNDSALLDFLLSGDSWVCRGNGMYIQIQLSVQGEPLARADTDELAGNIAWNQLNLQPSLPVLGIGVDPLLYERGKIRININHARGNTTPTASKHHRIFSNVHFADIKPPDGVPIIYLQSIRFSMEVFRIQQSIKTKGRKRLKVSSSEVRLSDSDTPKKSDRKSTLMECSSQDANGDTTPKQSVAMPHAATNPGSTTFPVALHDIGRLVDGAMRLSISRSLPKSATGLKIAANTFNGSLSNISPALWRPGYLSALSQRVHFMPIISRSLGQVSRSKIETIPLRDKFFDEKKFISQEADSGGLNASEADIQPILSSINARLWVYTQKELVSNAPTEALKAFWDSETQASLLLGSDDMLDDHRPLEEIYYPSIRMIDVLDSISNASEDKKHHIILRPSKDASNSPVREDDLFVETTDVGMRSPSVREYSPTENLFSEVEQKVQEREQSVPDTTDLDLIGVRHHRDVVQQTRRVEGRPNGMRRGRNASPTATRVVHDHHEEENLFGSNFLERKGKNDAHGPLWITKDLGIPGNGLGSSVTPTGEVS